MNKKIINFIFFLFLFLIPFKVNAEQCIYEVKIAYPDRDVSLNCYETYNKAKEEMNAYPSTEMAVATIVKNGA